MNKRHVGLYTHRLSSRAGNPIEIAFAEAWRRINNQNLNTDAYLEYLIPNYTPREEQVVATIIQWLGSPVGMNFIRDVFKSLPEDLREILAKEWER